LQVYAAYPVLTPCLPWLGALPVPVVIDHFGLVPLDGTNSERDAAALAQALSGRDLYVKLSGAYRIPGGTPQGAAQLSQTLIAAKPDKLIWASDWPHTNREPGKAPTQISRFRDISAAQLLNEVAQWLHDADTARKILSDNPAR